MILQKTLKEELTNKNHYYDSYIAPASLLNYLPLPIFLGASAVFGLFLYISFFSDNQIEKLASRSALLMLGNLAGTRTKSRPLPVLLWSGNRSAKGSYHPVVQIIKNRRNALSKCSFVKFVIQKRDKLKAVSNTVWICWKAMVKEKTIKKEWTYKKTISTIITATLLYSL